MQDILPMTKKHLWHVRLYNTKTFHLIYILNSLLTFSIFAPQARITILKLFVMEIEWKSFQGVHFAAEGSVTAAR